MSQLSSGVKYAIFVSTIGGMSFCDKNMQKGRMIKHIMGINKHHPQSVPGLQKRAPVMSKRQPLCQRGGNSTSRDGFGETKRKHPCQSQCASHSRVADITYSPETTNAFQELLTLIDENTKELPSGLSPAHYAALTQLPLTYPWARLVLDLKELLLSFDRHLLTCLIANNMQGNATPHPGTVLSSFSPASGTAHPAYHCSS